MSTERYIDVPDSIKPNCFERCPRICEGLSELAILSDQQTLATAAGTGYMSGQDAIHEQIDDQVPPEIADQVKKGIRQAIVSNMDGIDTRINEVREGMQQASASCADPLTMRAAKAGTTYTTTICTSPRVYPDAPTHAPAHVRTTPSN